MKQIFDWLREQCKDRSESCYKSYLKLRSDEDYGCSFAYSHAVDLINEAEAKWEADCCELLDKLIAETPQYRHGVCAFRNEEECVVFENCENCLVDAVKDIIKNSDSRFRKISEVE